MKSGIGDFSSRGDSAASCFDGRSVARASSGAAATARLSVKAAMPSWDDGENDSRRRRNARSDAHMGVCA